MVLKFPDCPPVIIGWQLLPPELELLLEDELELLLLLDDELLELELELLLDELLLELLLEDDELLLDEELELPPLGISTLQDTCPSKLPSLAEP